MAAKNNRKIGFTLSGLIAALFVVISPFAHALNYGDSTYNSACDYGCTNAAQDSTAETPANTTTQSSSSPTTPGPLVVPTSSVLDVTNFDNFKDGSGYPVSVSADVVLKFSLIVEDSTKALVDSSSSEAGVSIQGHTVTINSVTPDFVTITVASEPKTFKMVNGQAILLDLTGDNIDDIGIQVLSITPPTANLKIWKMLQKAKTSVTATTSKSGLWSSLLYSVAGITLLMILPNSFYSRINAFFVRSKKSSKSTSHAIKRRRKIESEEPTSLEPLPKAKLSSIIEKEDQGPVSAGVAAVTALKDDKSDDNDQGPEALKGNDRSDISSSIDSDSDDHIV